MTTEEKKIWAEMRTRFKSALSEKETILKQDLVMAHKLHYSVYGKPKHRPSINCCIDIATWDLMIRKLNADFVKKLL